MIHGELNDLFHSKMVYGLSINQYMEIEMNEIIIWYNFHIFDMNILFYSSMHDPIDNWNLRRVLAFLIEYFHKNTPLKKYLWCGSSWNDFKRKFIVGMKKFVTHIVKSVHKIQNCPLSFM